MDDATGLAEALLGLNGFGVLAVEETPSEVIVTVETTADFVGCPTCGVRRARGVLVDRDGRRGAPRHATGRGPQTSQESPGPRHR